VSLLIQSRKPQIQSDAADPAARIGVMQMLDTLSMGGAEKVGVNLANLLPRNRFALTLCTTRGEGALAASVAGDVVRLELKRSYRWDWNAVHTLATFIRNQNIRLIHAHGSSLFMARLTARLAGGIPVLWHDHYGRCEFDDRSAPLYRLGTHNIAGVIAVNELLADWARRRLRVPDDRVWYVPNLVESPEPARTTLELPGTPGMRIVCVANIRPQKGHITLLHAMNIVIKRCPAAHLLLVGDYADELYYLSVQKQIPALGLENNVTLLGCRTDVPAILVQCDIAVLSSISEGLPLSLLEYGVAGLPAVATSVGQCAEVLDNGRLGILVPPESPERLADGLLLLLESPGLRLGLGTALRNGTLARYGAPAILKHICRIYDIILSRT
jgi:glycosyltransferase involved in cell wall biosynthesis